MKSKTTVVLLAATALAATLACSRENQGTNVETNASAVPHTFTLPPQQRSQIHLVSVVAAPLRRVVNATGTVAFDQNLSTQVISQISGPVARLLVAPGARVVSGTPLAEVSSPDFASDVSTYRKSVVNAANLRRIADLDKKLFEGGGIARRDMEQAQTDAVSAEADRDSALEQLRSLGIPEGSLKKIQQGKSIPEAVGLIRSPIAGTVVERLITPGQVLQGGTTVCFTVANLSKMWVMTNVFATDLPFVQVGEPAGITLGSSDQPLPGTVDYVGAEVDPGTRAVSVRVVAGNPDDALKNNAYVTVAIHSNRETTGILVPVSAVLLDAESLPFVYVEEQDGSFARRRVTLGVRNADNYQILAGLTPGEKVVAEGGLFMQFAQNQ